MEPIISCPKSVTLVRHGQSGYNVLRAQKEADPLYQKFVRAYEASMTSRETHDLAKKVQKKFAPQWGDHDTPLTKEGVRQAKITGQKLGVLIPCPDIIFASPHLRTRDTLTHLANSWPDNYMATPGRSDAKWPNKLQDVETIFEELLREQSYGLGILFNDWRVFQTFMPEQKKFRELDGPYWYRYPQGESRSDARLRDRIFKSEYAQKCAGKNILIVAHHISILSYVANQEGLTPEEFMRLDENDRPINCGVTIYKTANDKLELESYNKCLWK